MGRVTVLDSVFVNTYTRGASGSRSAFRYKKAGKLALLLGSMLTLSSLISFGLNYMRVGGYFFEISTIDVFVTQAYAIIFFPLGVWLLCEGFENLRRQRGLINDISKGYWTPVLAIIISALAVGFTMEILNLKHGYWVYANWPLQNFHIFGLPAVMILVGWPLHFLMFLSIFRVFAPKESTEVWRLTKARR